MNKFLCKKSRKKKNQAISQFEKQKLAFIEMNAKHLYSVLITETSVTKNVAKRVEEKYIMYYSNHVAQETSAKQIKVDFIDAEDMLEALTILNKKGKILFWDDGSFVTKTKIIITRKSWFVVTDKIKNGTIYVVFCT